MPIPRHIFEPPPGAVLLCPTVCVLWLASALFLGTGGWPGPALGGGALAAASPARSGLGAFDQSVGYGPSYFQDLWQHRQQALNRGDFRLADTFLLTLIDAKQRSGWPDLLVIGEALASESRGAMAAKDVGRAMELARLGTQLAPHRLATWQTYASTCWAAGQVKRGLLALGHGASLLMHEAPYAWTLRGNFALMLFCGLVAAATAFALVGLYRHWVPLCHQISHRLPRGTTPWQQGLLVGSVALLPAFLRLGPCWTAVLWILALAPFLRSRERSAAAGLLLCLGLASATLGWTTAYLGFGNSRAERLYLTVRDIDAQQAAQDLSAYPALRTSEFYALGLRARWLGDLDKARMLLEKVAKDEDARGVGLQILLGNLQFLQGDAPGAIKSYDEALQGENNNVLALFNKAQVYASLSDPQAEALRRAAGNVDLDLVDRLSHYAARTGLRVVDPQPPQSLLANMTLRSSPDHAEAVRQLWHAFGGATSRWLLAFVAMAAAGGIVAWGMRHAQTSWARACHRCGAPACRACDPTLLNTEVCGACHEAFEADVPIAQNRRITQEIESFRYRARQLEVQRVCNLLCAGAGQLLRGDTLRGLVCVTLFVTFGLEFACALGLLPDPLPLYAAPLGMRRVVWSTLLLLLYGLAVLDGQRERQP